MFDDFRLMRNPVTYLTGRRARFGIKAATPHMRPRRGAFMKPVPGNPMGSYGSVVPGRAASELDDHFMLGAAVSTYRYADGVDFTARMLGEQLELALAPVKTAVRALPWAEDATTYMRLDDEAEVWFTGPLSGCNIYAVRSGRDIWVFHANSNTNAGNIALNNDAKRTSALNVAGTVGTGFSFESRLERGDPGYSGGFVFGWRKGDAWSHYHHDGEGTVTPLR